jgi:hypothetical protein
LRFFCALRYKIDARRRSTPLLRARATPYNTHTTRTSKCRFSLRYARRRLSPLRRSRCPTNSESPAR